MKLFIKIGNVLRSERRKQQLSIRDVAHRTKIQPHLLEALENGVFTVFPSPSYLKSFALQYAEFLGLDLHQDLDRISTHLDLRDDDLMSKSERAFPPLRDRERAEEKVIQLKAATLALQPLVVVVLSVAFVATAFFTVRLLDRKFTLNSPRPASATAVTAIDSQQEVQRQPVVNPIVQTDSANSAREF